MADKSTYSRAFNTHFFEFLDDIIAIFPENTDIKAARLSFDTIKRANPSIIIKVWYTFVYLPYKEILDSGDITFFINKDYKEDLSTLGNSSDIMKIVDKLRDPLRNMGETNKQHSTKYIQNLCKLSVLYNDQ